ncbi:MAG TPA: FadR/GntR family transcriptional regulator [Hyphomicrobiaceae bacterium]
MPLEVLAPRRLYRQIADQLRQLIDDGEYPVGGRLPTERELAETLGVSRPTVREALIALEVEGRLRIKVGSGIYVTDQQPAAALPAPDPIAGPLELLSARAFVESAVAEEAARAAGPEDVARLDAVLAEAEATPLSCDTWITLDRRFHVGLVATLGNAVLVRCVGDLFDQRINPYYARLAQHFENPATWRTAHEEHRAVRDAIAAHDPQRARAAMRTHLERSHERFCHDFGEAPDHRHGSPHGSPQAGHGASARPARGRVARSRPQAAMARMRGKAT